MHLSHEFWTLVWTQLWQVSIAVLLAGAFTARYGRRHPHLTHLLWMLVIVKSLVPPVLSTPVSMFSWLNTTASSVPALERELQPPSFLTYETDSLDTALEPIPEGALSREAPAEQWSSPAPARQLPTVHPFVAAWLIGALFLLSYALLHWWRFARQMRSSRVPTPDWLERLGERVRFTLGIKRRFRVVVNSAGVGPLVVGYFRPTLVLPSEIVEVDKRRRLEPVLAHEMVHARRGDTLMGLVQFVAQVIWWYNPLLWWANRQMNRYCERCCDEEVIAGLKCRPTEYAHALLDVLELKNRIRAVPAMMGVRSSDVTASRLSALVHRNWPFAAKTPVWHFAAFILIGVLMIPGARIAGVMGSRVESQHLPATAELTLKADAFFEQGEWEKAATFYDELTTINQCDGRAWFRKGYALHASGRVEEALEAHMRSAEFLQCRQVAIYNWACALALLGREEEAMAKLEEAVACGFKYRFPIQNDPDLKCLLDHKGFDSVARRLAAYESIDAERQFDFWVGEWELLDGHGQRIGSSVVTRRPDSNVLTATWSHEELGEGSSSNYYDRQQSCWRQTRIHNSGRVVQYKGRLVDGNLSFVGEAWDLSGGRQLRRMTFLPLPNGHVRQRIEQSNDNGQTWGVCFEGVYSPSRTDLNVSLPAT